jgi:hypothetical protein
MVLERSVHNQGSCRRLRIFDFQPRLQWPGLIRRVHLLFETNLIGFGRINAFKTNLSRADGVSPSTTLGTPDKLAA